MPNPFTSDQLEYLSKNTKEKEVIESMQKEIQQIKEKISTSDINIALIQQDVTYLKETFNKFVDSADKRYAPKYITKIVWGITCGGGAVLLWLVQSILDKIFQ